MVSYSKYPHYQKLTQSNFISKFFIEKNTEINKQIESVPNLKL